MKDTRPVNLDLTTIKLPITAVISILHRISGVIIFLMIPVLLWLMERSTTANGFNQLKTHLDNPFIKIIVWGTLAAMLYHLVAGIRHLLMDMQIGETLKAGRMSAWLVLLVSALLIIGAGAWLW